MSYVANLYEIFRILKIYQCLKSKKSTKIYSSTVSGYTVNQLSIYCDVLLVFLVPVPSVEIFALSNQTVGQSLTLESIITTVRGITSRMDIVWSSNGVELRRINNANISFTVNDSEQYQDSLNIPLLSTSDDGRVFQCELIIMTTPSIIVATNNITLDVTGKC